MLEIANQQPPRSASKKRRTFSFSIEAASHATREAATNRSSTENITCKLSPLQHFKIPPSLLLTVYFLFNKQHTRLTICGQHPTLNNH